MSVGALRYDEHRAHATYECPIPGTEPGRRAPLSFSERVEVALLLLVCLIVALSVISLVLYAIGPSGKWIKGYWDGSQWVKGHWEGSWMLWL